MRHLSNILRGVALAALILSVASVTATAAVTSHGGGNGGSDNSGHGNGRDRPTTMTPASTSAAPTTPPAQASKPATPPGQSGTKPGATPATPATPGADGTPATPATPATAAATPVPPAAPPALGKSMGLKPVAGTVTVRLPNSSGYAPLAAAGSIPSGAVIDARAGTLKLQSAIDAKGRTQTATVRGAIFEVRQSATGNGMTDLILREGRPTSCPSTSAKRATARAARAAMTHGIATKAKGGSSGGLWAQDRHGRFRSRGRNSVATVRGTRWVTRETCAGTLTRVMDGAVDVFDRRTHRTVRVRAGHSYLARTAG
jgi:hypothetical protein